MPEQHLLIEAFTLDLVQSIEAAATAESIASELRDFIARLGFDHVCCMKVPEHGEAAVDQVLVNSNPEDWIKRYVDRDYVKRDPMVVELFRTVQPFAWSDVVRRRALPKNDRRIVDEATEFRMNVGFVVPIFGSDGYLGLASVSGEFGELPQHVRAALQLACVYAHNRLLALKRNREREERHLTPRELECLRWATAGKTDWEIGEILCISEKTVNFHLENVKRKFGAATRMQAVVSAMREGRLFPY